MERSGQNLYEKEEKVNEIVNQLRDRRDKWSEILLRESMGGNAGENRSAINAFVDKKTGLIIEFGNSQDISPEIKLNTDYGIATFLYNHGSVFKKIRHPEMEEIPPFFENVLGGGISQDALENLKEAIRRFNKIMEEDKKSP